MDEHFRKKVIALCGNKGKQWLETLPDIIKIYENRWNIQVSSPFPLSYNYVAPAKRHDGKDVVLKISFPENNEFIPEIEALRLFSRDVAIKVLEQDLENSVVLLEQAVPGTRLRDIAPDNKQIAIATQVIKKLHKPIPQEKTSLFKTVADWAKAFERYKDKYTVASGPVPKKLFDTGEGIFHAYLQEKRQQVLLHGDLQSDNILLSDRGWLAIDPKGIIGESEFELGTYLRNPLYDFPQGTDYKAAETKRILQFSEELGFDKERVRNWTLASAILSLLWFLEDENEFKEIYVQNAELLMELKV